MSALEKSAPAGTPGPRVRAAAPPPPRSVRLPLRRRIRAHSARAAMPSCTSASSASPSYGAAWPARRRASRACAAGRLALAAAAACAPRGARALYFYVSEGAERCFIEEVPAETLIVGTYSCPDVVPWGGAGFTGVGVGLTVLDPARNAVLAKALEPAGRFALTTAGGGEYSLCFATNASRWQSGGGRRYRLDLSLAVGETGVDYAEVAKREHLSELEVEMRRLNDKLKDLTKEQLYQRERELAFRATSESTAARVKWWSLFQTAAMLAAGLWQIYHLRTFLKSKKIN